MNTPRLLPPASPALLAMGPWRAPLQELLQPRSAFEEVLPALPPEPLVLTSKKTARQASAPRRAVLQLDWLIEPYTMVQWLRLPNLREASADIGRDLLSERRRIRKRTLPARARLTKCERQEQLRIRWERLPVRPVHRSQCADVPRPCPFVSCRHHLYLDVNPETGAITLNFPGLDPGEMEESCSLDVADRIEEGSMLEVVPLARLLNRTTQRAHGMIGDALAELGVRAEAHGIGTRGGR